MASRINGPLVLVFVVMFLGAFAMLLVSFIYAVMARHELNKIVDQVDGFFFSWRQDLVFDISYDKTSFDALNLPNMYVDTWKFEWPGTINGCQCDSAARKKSSRVRTGLKSRACNSTETKAGCTQIPESKPLNASKWTSGKEIYVAKVKDTSFLSTYQQMNSDGSCQSGYKNCGSKSSDSRGFCIPSAIPSCPLTDISSQAKSGYTLNQFDGFAVYTSKSPNSQTPFTDLEIVQGKQCLNRSNKSLADGQDKYLLLRRNYSNCFGDVRTAYLSEMGQVDFFNLNSVDYQKLISYNADNKFKFKLAAGRNFEWFPSCFDLVPQVSDKKGEALKIRKSHNTLLGLYITSLVLSVIWFMLLLISCTTEDRMFLLIIGAVRLGAFILALPSMIIVTKAFSSNLSFFRDVQARQCTNEDYNDHLKSVFDTWEQKIHKKHITMLVVGIVGFVLEVISTFFLYRLLPEKAPSLINCEPPESAEFLAAKQPTAAVPAWVAYAVVLENDVVEEGRSETAKPDSILQDVQVKAKTVGGPQSLSKNEPNQPGHQSGALDASFQLDEETQKLPAGDV